MKIDNSKKQTREPTPIEILIVLSFVIFLSSGICLLGVLYFWFVRICQQVLGEVVGGLLSICVGSFISMFAFAEISTLIDKRKKVKQEDKNNEYTEN